MAMSTLNSRVVIGLALDNLQPFLTSYVTSALGSRENSSVKRTDIQALLGAILANWDSVFVNHLSRTARHYVFELKETRNRWAHQEAFSDDDMRRAIDTAVLLARAIKAPIELERALRQLAGAKLTESVSTPATRVTNGPK